VIKRTTLLALVLAASSLAGAALPPYQYDLTRGRSLDDVTPVPRLASNVIIDIVPTSINNRFWLGTGGGITRMTLTHNEQSLGQSLEFYVSFESFGEAQGLGKGSASGLVVTDTIIWASFAFDTTVGVSGAGGGLAYSRDGGLNWTHVPQPRDRIHNTDASGFDNVLGYWPTTTNVDNITYDIALSDSFVWIVSKGGGTRRHAYSADYTDYNDTTGWRAVSPLALEDGRSLPFHPGDPSDGLYHRTFSVIYAEGALYVGTAAGILKSTNEGRTWRSITALNSGISGNFVTALGYQPDAHAIWAATWRAESSSEFYAVSKSTDGGTTWTVHLDSAQVARAIGRHEVVRAHSFAFNGQAAYVCDDLGLWKSPDGGATWDLFSNPVDTETGRRFYETQTYGAYYMVPDTLGPTPPAGLWVGGVDGLAFTMDEGASWHLFQTAVPPSDPARSVDTYAYPNPWSPQRFGPVKLRYTTSGGSVKVTIYDFAMSKVVELPSVTRAAGEQYEVWDGRKNGEIVANGTYFYKIEKSGGDVWGKLVVLD